jgi:hypothetical protein
MHLGRLTAGRPDLHGGHRRTDPPCLFPLDTIWTQPAPKEPKTLQPFQTPKRRKALSYKRKRSLLNDFEKPGSDPEPDAVAEAVLDFMTSDIPARRYLVVGNQYEAEITIAKVIEELVQLNGDHPFSYSREELIRMLDEALARKP